MKLSSDQVLQQAIKMHEARKYEDAERLYRTILAVQPNHSEANHNLGLLAIGIGKPQQALKYLKAALKANPCRDLFWISYINALIEANQIVNARFILEEAKKNGLTGQPIAQLEQKLKSVDNQKPIIIVMGMSGVGKSTTCHFAQEHMGWVWVELDIQNIPPFSRIKQDHDLFPPALLGSEYIQKLQSFLCASDHKGALISFGSVHTMKDTTANLLKLYGIDSVLLDASEDFCLESFVKREAKTGRNLPASHWIANNQKRLFFSRSLQKSCIRRIKVHNEKKERFTPKEIFDSMLENLAI